jgi:hypothetical protein
VSTWRGRICPQAAARRPRVDHVRMTWPGGGIESRLMRKGGREGGSDKGMNASTYRSAIPGVE